MFIDYRPLRTDDGKAKSWSHVVQPIASSHSLVNTPYSFVYSILIKLIYCPLKMDIKVEVGIQRGKEINKNGRKKKEQWGDSDQNMIYAHKRMYN